MPGETINGALTFAGEQDVYSITPGGAAALYLDSLTNRSDIQWTLTDSSANVVSQQQLDQSDSLHVLNDTSYLLTVSGVGAATGSYTLRVIDPATGATSVTPGSISALPAVSGS